MNHLRRRIARHSTSHFPSTVRHLSSQSLAGRRKGKIVFSGIQPTGIPHLGNFLGALQSWRRLQQDAQPEDKLLFSIVGWHALTLPQNSKSLLQSRNDMLAVLLAIGLDPKLCILFQQDENPDHQELAWILSCLVLRLSESFEE